MNRNQKISLIGFFIGLIMILNLILYSNNYTFYIVSAGFILSLSCALAYSLFQYISITPENEKNVQFASSGYKDSLSEEFEDNSWNYEMNQREKQAEHYIYVLPDSITGSKEFYKSDQKKNRSWEV